MDDLKEFLVSILSQVVAAIIAKKVNERMEKPSKRRPAKHLKED